MLLSSVLPVMGAEKDTIRFQHDPPFDSLLAQARETGKPIFLDAYATWCGPCKWMDKNMFTIDSVADFYNEHFICAKYDMEKGEGVKLKQRFNVIAYPTYLLIGSDGNILDSVIGMVADPGAFIGFGTASLQPNEIDPTEMSQSELLFAMQQAKSLNRNTDALADLFFARQSDATDSLSWHVIRNYAGEGTVAFHYVLGHRKAFYDKHNADTVDLVIQQTYGRAMFEVIFTKPTDTARYQRMRSELVSQDFWFSERMIMECDLAYYEQIGNWEAYGYTATTYVPYYADSNWVVLNQIAWTVYEHVDNPNVVASAVEWAARSVELNENYYNLDTYACCLYKAGKKRQAKKVAKRAIQSAKEYNANPELVKNGWPPIDYSHSQQLLETIKGK